MTDVDILPVGVIEQNQPYPIETDHLGTPRVVADSKNDVVLWRWDIVAGDSTHGGSNAFGDQPPNEDVDGDGKLYNLEMRFPGQLHDSETGLHYNYFRDYEPGTGRYVESDPIGLQGGLSTYGYVGANPGTGIDPFGLAECFYSVGSHELRCYARPEPPDLVGPPRPRPAVVLNGNDVFSGQGECRNNPTSQCAQDSFDGPVPPGEYFMNPDGRAGKENHWRLEPNPPVSGWEYATGQKRNGFKLHPGSVSQGCITINPNNPELMLLYMQLHRILQNDTRNTLYVKP